ncbi:aspartate-semialdehyde dehydrogenase [Streptomyces albireticuli]|uniref:Aspartate-semialdehyde dehydrogenase n=1 Tax=Streptomyces albireticuli TaxID=1940 RepID=A0A2A2DAK6_9ACTN|nr:aspartate-semialdehyde dehydrogenase [Streptomyces albireticuli]MCD9145150.1 aspartate-semialdehyde dehydrogenase [Streptomyces albireticuli]MCD9164675.1 aspartate-semialdehyde dehydrogenase [Streptomyces albireticuli]MCD9194940.1 aspartate-semialdehyde dehydrogenase [Streptomyces albireticuli]PAU49523.1 aspartate-semialdehyde dehydrogenase [Streptomyces albireticuli]
MTGGYAARPVPAGTGRKPTLAVVGATGAVGTVMLEILSRHADVWGEIRLVASARSAGRTLAVRGVETPVLALAEEVFDGVDVAMFDVPDDVAARWAPIATAKGVVVVDNSGAFRMDPDVPLVVPEVNAHAARVRPRGIISNPNCTTLSMIVAVGALHAEFGLSGLVVSSYQAASGAGKAGVDTLRAQLAAVAGASSPGTGTGGGTGASAGGGTGAGSGMGVGAGTQPGDVRRAVGDAMGPFPAPLALNVVPWVGSPREDGWSSEELKIRDESRKILGLPGLPVSATCVRVPVITTHSLTVHARFEKEVSVAQAHEILANAPGVVLVDDPAEGEFPTPADAVGTDPTWVGRVRRALDDPKALEFFVCGDNLRKGAALNTAQIAEFVAAELTTP